MKFSIKHRFDSDKILFECEATSWADALKQAYAAGADLSGAYLSGANLSGAKASKAQVALLVSQNTILPGGDLIGYKKLCNQVIVKLRIPADARRVGGVVGRKCRAEYAEVIEGSGYSLHDFVFKYTEGKRATPDSFDDNPLVECAPGIHFFITRAEAEAY